MAVTRRGYIFSAFLLSVLCLLLTIVSISSDSWVGSSARVDGQNQDSTIRYGLFRGVFEDRVFATTVSSTLYMTCLVQSNACAVSCKTNRAAREEEVKALAEGFRPTPTCISVTTVDTTNPLETPPVISFVFYLFVVMLLCLQLLFAAISALLAIINATKNPTEPIFGLPGCLWSNVVTAILGVVVLMMFGIYWASSGLNTHLAFSFIALDFFEPFSALGYSYWLLIAAVCSSIASTGLIRLRSYLLERDPPPPTLKMDNHSDGTIFLY
ncbi:uncharacterized protein LOC106134604 isoform X1 [Amyelois transitella]|uniref:uncharacterized protein LOC106134604 isoform X1 n=1 Tax=Amyelois transitella TaxID=680683 RepID=UPI00067B12EA|nr:uncharacterized protein LOC106134604 isoform X1 [Amyelois transitella]